MSEVNVRWHTSKANVPHQIPYCPPLLFTFPQFFFFAIKATPSSHPRTLAVFPRILFSHTLTLILGPVITSLLLAFPLSTTCWYQSPAHLDSASPVSQDTLHFFMAAVAPAAAVLCPCHLSVKGTFLYITRF